MVYSSSYFRRLQIKNHDKKHYVFFVCFFVVLFFFCCFFLQLFLFRFDDGTLKQSKSFDSLSDVHVERREIKMNQRKWGKKNEKKMESVVSYVGTKRQSIPSFPYVGNYVCILQCPPLKGASY